jgi:hypothetical protein
MVLADLQGIMVDRAGTLWLLPIVLVDSQASTADNNGAGGAWLLSVVPADLRATALVVLIVDGPILLMARTDDRGEGITEARLLRDSCELQCDGISCNDGDRSLAVDETLGARCAVLSCKNTD